MGSRRSLPLSLLALLLVATCLLAHSHRVEAGEEAIASILERVHVEIEGKGMFNGLEGSLDALLEVTVDEVSAEDVVVGYRLVEANATGYLVQARHRLERELGEKHAYSLEEVEAHDLLLWWFPEACIGLSRDAFKDVFLALNSTARYAYFHGIPCVEVRVKGGFSTATPKPSGPPQEYDVDIAVYYDTLLGLAVGLDCVVTSAYEYYGKSGSARLTVHAYPEEVRGLGEVEVRGYEASTSGGLVEVLLSAAGYELKGVEHEGPVLRLLVEGSGLASILVRTSIFAGVYVEEVRVNGTPVSLYTISWGMDVIRVAPFTLSKGTTVVEVVASEPISSVEEENVGLEEAKAGGGQVSPPWAIAATITALIVAVAYVVAAKARGATGAS